MNIFKRILKILAIIILVIAAVGFIFFPGKIHIERSVSINKPAALTYGYISDWKNWNNWSPWFKKDPNAKYEFGNVTTGVGATLKWQSEKREVGTGSMTFSELKPDSLVRIAMRMGGSEAGSYYRIVPEGETTIVTWAFDGDMGANPLLRIMGHFMKDMMANDFDSGLAALKILLESMEDKPAYQVEEVNIPAGNYLYVKDHANEKSISEHLGKDYNLIGMTLEKQQLQMAGAPFAIYYTEANSAWDFDAAILIDKKGKNDGDVKAGTRKEGKAVVVHYFGPYMGSYKAHNMAKDYIQKNNKTIAGAPWEVYVTDPGTEKDTMKWQTDVFYPVK